MSIDGMLTTVKAGIYLGDIDTRIVVDLNDFRVHTARVRFKIARVQPRFRGFR